MKLNVIKNQNGNEVMNYSCELTSHEEIMSAIESIKNYVGLLKIDIIANNIPFEEIKEGNFKGFISPALQVITSGNHVDITFGNTNIQYHFLPSVGIRRLPILAA